MIKIIQDIQFPNDEICNRTKMYFNGDRCLINPLNHYCVIPHHETLDFFSYFNSFSLGKWKKYTILDNLSLTLKLKGKALIRIEFSKIINNRLLRNIIITKGIDLAEQNQISIVLPINCGEGVISFSITSLSDDVVFYGGSYVTDTDADILPEIHLEHGTHRIGIGTVDFQGIHEVHRITVEYERRLSVRELGIDTFAQVDFHGANFLGHRLDRRTQHHRSYLVLDRGIHRELDLFAGILVGIGVMVL